MLTLFVLQKVRRRFPVVLQLVIPVKKPFHADINIIHFGIWQYNILQFHVDSDEKSCNSQQH